MIEKVKPIVAPQKASTEDSTPSFIKKTYTILEEKKFPEIIDWNPEGTCLVIYDPKGFCQKVLPIYFKHNNLTSFVRQLNMYNFSKRRTREIEHIYFHEFFQRGKKHLLKEIKRKNAEHLLNLQKTVDTLESIQTTQETTGLPQENQLLTRLNREALSRITTLERKTNDLAIQNHKLWREVCIQSEREEMLKNILTDIMKQYDIPPNELPLMIKNEPDLFSACNKAEKDLIQRYLSTANNAFPEIELLGMNGTFLQRSNDKGNSCPKNLFGDPFDPRPRNPFKDEPDIKVPPILKKEKKENQFVKVKKEGNNVIHSPSHRWNLEAEYLKSLGETNEKFSNLFDEDKNKPKDSGLLGKRPLDLENSDQFSFDLAPIEAPESFLAGDLARKKKPSDRAILDDDEPKLDLFGSLDKKMFDLNSNTNLLNFDLS